MELNFTIDASLLIDRISRELNRYGGEFKGDVFSGQLKLNIYGAGDFLADYTITGQRISIVIKKKPFLVSNAMAEFNIKKFLNKINTG